MFQNQIPEFPDFGRQGIPPSKSDLTNAIPDLYPGKEQGWGVSCSLPFPSHLHMRRRRVQHCLGDRC
jgi:hypothetical protein